MSLTGFLCWALVSSRSEPATVGRAAALFSLTLFLVYLTAAGLPMAVAHYSRDRSAESGITFTWACLLTTATSALGAAVLLLIGPESVQPLVRQVSVAGAFVLLTAVVGGLSLSAGLDLRLTAIRKRAWGAASWLAAGLLRLPVLLVMPVASSAASLWIVIAGVLAIRGPLVIAVLHRSVGPIRVRPVPARWRSMLEYTGVNAVSQLVEEGPFILLPVLVLSSVAPSTNAAFYVAWSFAMGVFILQRMVSNSLLVEGALSGEELRHQTRFAMQVSLACAAVATLLSFPGAVLIVWAFGPAYQAGADVLPLLTGASFFGAISSALLGEARVRHDRISAVAIPLVLGCGVLGLAAVGVERRGLFGVAVAWFVGQAAAAAAALLLRRRSTRREADTKVDTHVPLGASSPGAGTGVLG